VAKASDLQAKQPEKPKQSRAHAISGYRLVWLNADVSNLSCDIPVVKQTLILADRMIPAHCGLIRGDAMQHIGKSKIGSLTARKGIRYPQLRLPQQCPDVIGCTADIVETESEGKRAFLIITPNHVKK